MTNKRTFNYYKVAEKEGYQTACGMLYFFLNQRKINDSKLDCNTGLPRWNHKRLASVKYKYIYFTDGSRELI